MFTSVTLDGSVAKTIIADAAGRRERVAVASQEENHWLTGCGHLISAGSDHVVLRLAQLNPPHASPLPSFRGRHCRLSFKLRNHAYFLNSVLELARTLPESIEPDERTYSAAIPELLTQFSRRVQDRLTVPSGVRADFWPWDVKELAWSGQVQNLSLTGLQVRTACSIVPVMEVGDLVSISLRLGLHAMPILIGGHFRYGQPDGQMALVGLALEPTMLRPEDLDMIRTFLASLQEKAGVSSRH